MEEEGGEIRNKNDYDENFEDDSTVVVEARSTLPRQPFEVKKSIPPLVLRYTPPVDMDKYRRTCSRRL